MVRTLLERLPVHRRENKHTDNECHHELRALEAGQASLMMGRKSLG